MASGDLLFQFNSWTTDSVRGPGIVVQIASPDPWPAHHAVLLLSSGAYSPSIGASTSSHRHSCIARHLGTLHHVHWASNAQNVSYTWIY